MNENERKEQNARVAADNAASEKLRREELERERMLNDSRSHSTANEFWKRRQMLTQKNKGFAGLPAEVVKTIAYTP